MSKLAGVISRRSRDVLDRIRHVLLSSALREEGCREHFATPTSIRILLESVLRHVDGRRIRDEDVEALARWQPGAARTAEVPFLVGRVLLQDFTDTAARRAYRMY